MSEIKTNEELKKAEQLLKDQLRLVNSSLDTGEKSSVRKGRKYSTDLSNFIVGFGPSIVLLSILLGRGAEVFRFQELIGAEYIWIPLAVMGLVSWVCTYYMFYLWNNMREPVLKQGELVFDANGMIVLRLSYTNIFIFVISLFVILTTEIAIFQTTSIYRNYAFDELERLKGLKDSASLERIEELHLILVTTFINYLIQAVIIICDVFLGLLAERSRIQEIKLTTAAIYFKGKKEVIEAAKKQLEAVKANLEAQGRATQHNEDEKNRIKELLAKKAREEEEAKKTGSSGGGSKPPKQGQAEEDVISNLSSYYKDCVQYLSQTFRINKKDLIRRLEHYSGNMFTIYPEDSKGQEELTVDPIILEVDTCLQIEAIMEDLIEENSNLDEYFIPEKGTVTLPGIIRKIADKKLLRGSIRAKEFELISHFNRIVELLTKKLGYNDVSNPYTYSNTAKSIQRNPSDVNSTILLDINKIKRIIASDSTNVISFGKNKAISTRGTDLYKVWYDYLTDNNIEYQYGLTDNSSIEDICLAFEDTISKRMKYYTNSMKEPGKSIPTNIKANTAIPRLISAFDHYWQDGDLGWIVDYLITIDVLPMDTLSTYYASYVNNVLVEEGPLALKKKFWWHDDIDKYHSASDLRDEALSDEEIADSYLVMLHDEWESLTSDYDDESWDPDDYEDYYEEGHYDPDYLNKYGTRGAVDAQEYRNNIL